MKNSMLALLLLACVGSAEARVVLTTEPASPLAPGQSFYVVGCGFNKKSAVVNGDANGCPSWEACDPDPDFWTWKFTVAFDGCIHVGDSPTFTAPPPGTYIVAVCQRSVQGGNPCAAHGTATLTVQ